MHGLDLTHLPLGINALLFAAGAAAIWIAGSRLALCAESLAERTGWGQALVGLVLLAGATELPELATTLSAVSIGDAPLALNNVFGGIVMQTAILAVADLTLARGPLSYHTPDPDLLLQGVLLAGLLAVVLAGAIAGEPFAVLGVGAWSALAFLLYLVAVVLLRRTRGSQRWRPLDLPEAPPETTEPRGPSPLLGWSTPRISLSFAGASAVVLVAGSGLVFVGEALAAQSGLGSSFVGATLLAGTTSLPELSTTIAAVRLGAYSMAFANIFGSNAIMVVVLFLADATYRQGPLLDAADPSALFAAAAGIAVTAVYLAGLLVRRERQLLRMGVDSLVTLGAYAVTLLVLYSLRAG